MINDQLVEYIKRQLLLNVSKEKIIADLKPQGWSEEEIQEAFLAPGVPTLPSGVTSITKPQDYGNTKLKPKSAKALRITLVILFLLGALYIGREFLESYIINEDIKTLTPVVSDSSTSETHLSSNEILTTIEKVVPQEREIKATEFKQVKEYSFEDSTFSVPWSDLVEQKGTTLSLNLKFLNDKSIKIFESPLIGKREEFLKDPTKTEQLQQILGPENFQSDYSFFRFMFGITAEDIERETGIAKDLKVLFYTLKKVTLIPTQTTQVTYQDKLYIVYSFTTPYIKGFQLDSVLSPSKMIEIFDLSGKSKYLISIKGSQEEVDYILSTLKFKN